MDHTFADQPCIFVYLDDNLATTAEEHLQVLRQVFQLLKDNGLVLNLQKCEFFQDSITFLGHKVHSGGVEPLSGHVDAITNTPLPSSPKELQRFPGMINFYHRFLPAAANILCPLTEALKGNPKVLSWSAEMQAATTAIKAELVATIPLSHPLPAAQLSLATDASDSHIGGVLQQWEAGAWWPLGFYSRKLSETECRYSAFDRELLAAFSSIRHFRIMLEGRHFQLWTYHKPLLAALHRVLLPWMPWQQRQLAFIAECTTMSCMCQGCPMWWRTTCHGPWPPRFRWQQLQQLTVHVPSSVAGLHVLEFLRPSPLIGVHSSLRLCGLLCVSSSTSSTCRPLPTIQRATAWMNVSTATSRTPFVPAAQLRTGFNIFCGSCWA